MTSAAANAMPPVAPANSTGVKVDTMDEEMRNKDLYGCLLSLEYQHCPPGDVPHVIDYFRARCAEDEFLNEFGRDAPKNYQIW